MGQVDKQYTRQKIGDFAVKVANEYRHHADLAAYATMRVNGTLSLPVGTKDRSWWALLMDECVAKRDALEQVARWMRTDLGVKVSLPAPDWTRGMEIYLRDFLVEGSELTFDEYVLSIGLDYTRPDDAVIMKLQDAAAIAEEQDGSCGSRSFEAPGSAGAPDIPPEVMTDGALERAHQEGEGYGTPDRSTLPIDTDPGPAPSTN